MLNGRIANTINAFGRFRKPSHRNLVLNAEDHPGKSLAGMRYWMGSIRRQNNQQTIRRIENGSEPLCNQEQAAE